MDRQELLKELASSSSDDARALRFQGNVGRQFSHCIQLVIQLFGWNVQDQKANTTKGPDSLVHVIPPPGTEPPHGTLAPEPGDGT